MSQINVNIRMDENIKKQADELFASLGMNMTTAMNIFVHQALRNQGIPFEITRDVPNAETIAAIKEAEALLKNPNAKRYSSVDELFEGLKS